MALAPSDLYFDLTAKYSDTVTSNSNCTNPNNINGSFDGNDAELTAVPGVIAGTFEDFDVPDRFEFITGYDLAVKAAGKGITGKPKCAARVIVTDPSSDAFFDIREEFSIESETPFTFEWNGSEVLDPDCTVSHINTNMTYSIICVALTNVSALVVDGIAIRFKYKKPPITYTPSQPIHLNSNYLTLKNGIITIT